MEPDQNEPASQIDDDSPRQQLIQQGGEFAEAVYPVIDGVKKMTFDEFCNNVEAWADDRGIYQHSTKHAQALKAVSEIGELADAVIKNDQAALQDAIGDVIVCLVNLCVMSDLEIKSCCESAWNEIKDRKGHMVAGGAFVKDA